MNFSPYEAHQNSLLTNQIHFLFERQKEYRKIIRDLHDEILSLQLENFELREELKHYKPDLTTH